MARKASKSKSKSKAKLNPEVLIQLKAFKTSAAVENFYSFVYENNLRREAKILLETVIQSMPKKRKKSKTLH